MKRNEQGLYETDKFVKATGALITATGKTKHEAQKNLKKTLLAYYKNPLEPVGTCRSPRWEEVEKEVKELKDPKDPYSGYKTVKKQIRQFNPNAQAVIWANPAIAPELKKKYEEEKTNEQTS